MARKKSGERKSTSVPVSDPGNLASEQRGFGQGHTQNSVATQTSAADDGAIASSAGNPGFPVVGIGASAGGLESLELLFKNAPNDTGMAFVVVTHQHPDHPSLLPELMGRMTAMPVVETSDGTRLLPNHVYVGTPGGLLEIRDGTLHRVTDVEGQGRTLPIDHFLCSLAIDLKPRAICIILSGTGTDGTLGLKEIKANLGMVMVQQPQSAKYAGMPTSAIATGLADYVLPPESMADQLVLYSEGPYLRLEHEDEEAPFVPPEPLQKILGLLRRRTGHDFSTYKSNTIRRRIERRMNVHQVRAPELYIRFLQENPHELDILFKELLISVTSFFRDTEAWEALQQQLKELIRSRTDQSGLRAWVPGCATGEEAYSLAIALHEAMDAVDLHHEVQIFGSDLDPEAIETARAGQYPEGITANVSAGRLDRYFTHEEGTYRIREEIRDCVVFAPQNLIRDPPFTRLDILSCRNLLIYLNAEQQKKLLPVFHYALKPGGLLFLGPSETITVFTDLFEPLDKRWKIFRRKDSASVRWSLPGPPVQSVGKAGTVPVLPIPSREPTLSTPIERFLLKRFVPAAVVVNERGEIVHVHGRTGEFLEPAQGTPRHHVLDMAREGLQVELAAAIRQALRQESTITRQNVEVKDNGTSISANLTVERLREPESLRGLLLITFSRTPPAKPAGAGRGKQKKNQGDDRAQRLERELQYLKESHQTIREELETSNEELKSTNEELQSTNEELQSSNEELETSKEEMQSLNEELTTVNSELQSKLDELSQANDDMQNLLNSTDIATVFLDNDLNIKRFTEQARLLVRLRPTDVGRPISELASSLKLDNLAADCREVLRTLNFRESEVATTSGGWFLMRIVPYRTADNLIDGLVLTFVDIGRLKEAERSIEKSRSYFAGIVDTVRQPLIVLGSDLRVISANRAFYRTFQTTARRTEGELIYELDGGHWSIPSLRELLDEILPRNTSIDDYAVTFEVPQRGRRDFALNARKLEMPGGVDMILLSLEDTTGR